MKIVRILAAVLLAGFCTLAVAQRSGNDLFQEALRKERSEGDLKGAIEIYQRILREFSSDRNLAAQALLRTAACQERQGSEEARRTYERLVRDFADQTQAVAEARARIAALALPASSTEPRVRRVWAGPGVDMEGSVSPDGRWLTYAHWETGDLGLRDLVNNTNKLLTNTGGWIKSGGEFAQDSRFSPDGKMIAYNWFMPGGVGGYELRLMNADGSNVRTLGWANTPGYVVPVAWTPDGASVLVQAYGVDGLTSLHVVSVASGQTRQLVPPGRFLGLGLSVSPDGRWVALEGNANDGLRDLYVLPLAGSEPEPLVVHPAQDVTPFWSADGRSVLFTSNRSGSYGLWRVRVENGKAASPVELIRADLGGNIWAIGFTGAGALVYSVRVSGQEIYEADFDAVTGKATTKPVLISVRHPGNNSTPRLSPDGRWLSYVTRITGTRGAAVTVRDVESGAERVLPTGKDIRSLVWTPDSTRLLLETSSEEPNAHGLHWLDPTSGQLTLFRTIRPTRNPLCPTFSTDGKILYMMLREWPERAFGIIAMDVATGARKVLYETRYGPQTGGGLRGLSVSPDGELATVRYKNDKGELNRELLLAPSSGGEPRVVASFYSAGGDFSTRPEFTPDGKSVILRREKAHQPRRDSELIRIDLATGTQQPVGVDMDNLQFPQVDPSGRKIYFQAGRQVIEIWIAENILR